MHFNKYRVDSNIQLAKLHIEYIFSNLQLISSSSLKKISSSTFWPSLPGVDFISPFTLHAKLSCSTPSFLPQKECKKLCVELKSLAKSLKGVYEIHPCSLCLNSTFLYFNQEQNLFTWYELLRQESNPRFEEQLPNVPGMQGKYLITVERQNPNIRFGKPNTFVFGYRKFSLR